MAEALEVIVTVEGGVVQNVELPKGVVVKVRDYDVEGNDNYETLPEDEHGDKYVESIYEDQES